MTLSPTPGAIKRFRRTSWRTQQTFEIPGPDGRLRFTKTILAAVGRLEAATLIIDSVVFNASSLAALAPDAVLSAFARDASFSAAGREEAETLLLAALTDGLDFAFVPVPKPFVIYADHDDWITFFANSRSNLNPVVSPLITSGFKPVKDWIREL